MGQVLHLLASQRKLPGGSIVVNDIATRTNRVRRFLGGHVPVEANPSPVECGGNVYWLDITTTTIRHYHHILQDSDRLRQKFPSLPIIAFHRPRNLRDLLVRITISLKKSDPSGNFRCVARKRKTCPYWSF